MVFIYISNEFLILTKHFIFLDRNAAAPFANLENGGPPPLSQKVPGCVHISPDIKIAILKEILKYKKDIDVLDKALAVAVHYKVTNINKVKLKYSLKQWKHRAMDMHQEGQCPKTKADRLLFEIYDLKSENALSQCEEEAFDEDEAIIELSESAKMAVIEMIDLQPTILCRKASEIYRKQFWSKALEKVKEIDPDCKIDINSLRKAFWTWKSQRKSAAENLAHSVCENLTSAPIKANNVTEDFKAAILTELYKQQETLTFGTPESIKYLFNNLVGISRKHGVNLETGSELALVFSMWKEGLTERLKKGQHSQMSACERMILEICLGPNLNEGLNARSKETILPLIKTHAFVLNHGDVNEKVNLLKEFGTSVQALQLNLDHLGLYKAIRRWKLLALKTRNLDMSLSNLDSELLETLETDFKDEIDLELLCHYLDSSIYDHKRLQVILPDAAKYVIFNAVTAKHDIVFGSNLREISNFWTETLELIKAKDNLQLVCPSKPTLLQRAFFVWICEAWKKRLNNGYLTPQENTLLDLAHLKKALLSEHFDYDENNINHLSDSVVEINEANFDLLVQDLLEIKELMQQGDKALFWTLGMKLAQALWINCDSPPRLFVTVMSWRIKAQQKILHHIPLLAYEKSIFELFGIANDLFSHEENEDDGDDVFEEENLWDSLTNEITDKAKMSILNSLVEHKEILITRRRGRLDHDR